ncbi:MAG: hypothetical protein J1E58_05105 [Prevotella sp.]|nr:hypothetical protein [Prevotella sp.]
MRLKVKLLSAVALLFAVAAAAQEKPLAFPGAEGFGRYVTGGRGGEVRHVTNLEDSGAGSLRAALEGGSKKTIVFDVSGTIHLKSQLNINSNTTIAGQTAPGDGICLADYPCAIKGNNIIVRYMRFRLGNKYVTVNGADGWDGFGALDCNDIIIDHCSVSWSIDECLSMVGCRNITVQWCLVAQSLVNSGHSKGNHGYGGNWGGAGSSYHHNLMVHHTSRTPRLGPRPTTQLDERMDMRNNVIYNWAGNGCYGGEGMNVNIVNNYYKPGPGTEQRGTNIQQRIAGIGIRTTEYITTYPDYAPAWHLWGKYYVAGNVNTKYDAVTNDNWTYGMYNQIDANGNDGTYTEVTKDTIRIDEPIRYIAVTTHSAEDAYGKVLEYAGASLHRDSFDELMVSDTRDGKATYTGTNCNKGCINSQEDNRPADAPADWSAWPVLNATAAPVDTDGDGMPDAWETANGLNPNDAADANAYAENGYTNLENYLNSLVEAITIAQNEGGTMQGDIIEVATPDADDGLTTVASGTLSWKFDTGEAAQTGTCSEELADAVELSSVTIGSNLSYVGTRTLGDSPLTCIQPLIKDEPSANADNALTFTLTVRDGYLFKPTKLSFTAARIGTDGGRMDLFWQNDGGKTEIESGILPERNNNFTSYDENVYGVAAAGGVNSLVIHIYKLGNTKQIALGNIVVTGELKTAATGISDIQIDRASDNVIYNLQGVRVPNLSKKGIYIVNGRKVVVR